MYVNFEFAALLPSPYSRLKKCAKFKTNIHLVSVDSFLYYLSSNEREETKRRSAKPHSKHNYRVHLKSHRVMRISFYLMKKLCAQLYAYLFS